MFSVRKNVKYKKVHKNCGGLKVSYKLKSNSLLYGFYGLQLKKSGFLTFKQLESARRCITRATKRKCKIWFRVFPDRPCTFKSKGSRMGKGVGKLGFWVFDAKSGCIVLEISYVNMKLAKKALISASKKISISTNILVKVRKNNNIFKYEVNRLI